MMMALFAEKTLSEAFDVVRSMRQVGDSEVVSLRFC